MLAVTNTRLDATGEEAVDQGLAVTVVTSLNEVAALLLEASLGGSDLVVPHTVGDGAEVLSGGVDLVDDVLDADDVLVVELVLDLLVVVDLDALSADLEVTALVDELANGGEGGVSVGDVGLDHAEHLVHGLVELHDDGVEDLAETEELEDLLLLGGDLGDTADAGDDGDLGGGLKVEVTVGLGLTAEGDELALGAAVLARVLKAALVGGLGEGLLLLLVGKDGLLEVLGLLLLEGGALDGGLGGGDGGHFSPLKNKREGKIYKNSS